MTTPFDVAEQELGDLAPARKGFERSGWKVRREQQEMREDLLPRGCKQQAPK